MDPRFISLLRPVNDVRVAASGGQGKPQTGESNLSINRPEPDITVTMAEPFLRDTNDLIGAGSMPVSSIFSLPLVRAPVARAALLWLALHVFVAAATDGAWTFGMSQTRFLVVIAAAVGYFDSRRRREVTFAGNLGVPSYLSPATWAATVILLEIALRVASAIID
jgi:hypothetical protein